MPAPRSRRLQRFGVLVVMTVLLAACNGDDEPALTPTALPTSTASVVTPTTTPSPTSTGTPPATASPTSPATSPAGSPTPTEDVAPFEANTEPDEHEAFGPIAVTDVRVGLHDGYDRIVFDIEGEGEAGWLARYTDRAAAQGSGEAIELDGDVVLDISITGAALPGDIDATPLSAERVDTGDLAVVRDIANDNIFEGNHHFVIGLDDRTPFRVFSLDDPQRVVLDIQH